jgi:outer membrane protein, heavy metal efflux system
MKKMIVACIAGLMTLAPSTRGEPLAAAQPERGLDATPFTLDSYLRTVTAGNLDLAASRLNVSIAQAQVAIAKVFPDPQMTAGLAQFDVSRQGNPTATVLGIDLPIELGGKRRARVAVADVGIAAAQAELEDFVRTLRSVGANAYVDALHARLVVDRKNKTLASLEHLVTVNEHRFAAGDIGEVQVTQARVEAQQFRAEVLGAEGTVETADLALIGLLGTVAGAHTRRAIELTGDLRKTAERRFEAETLLSFALLHRPDLLAADKRLSLARKQSELVQANRVIDVTLGASWQHYFATSGAAQLPASNFIGTTLTLPVPFSRMYRGDLDAARAAKDQSKIRATAAAIQVEVEVRQALAQYSKAAARVKLYTQGVLAGADNVQEKTLYNYQHGGATLVEVLVAERTVNDVYLAYYDALSDSAHALVSVEFAAALWDVQM